MMPTTVGAMGTTSEEFLLLQYPKDTLDDGCLWLIGNYVEIVDSLAVAKNKKLKVDQLRGILRGRLQGMSSRAVVTPQIYNI